MNELEELARERDIKQKLLEFWLEELKKARKEGNHEKTC